MTVADTLSRLAWRLLLWSNVVNAVDWSKTQTGAAAYGHIMAEGIERPHLRRGSDA